MNTHLFLLTFSPNAICQLFVFLYAFFFVYIESLYDDPNIPSVGRLQITIAEGGHSRYSKRNEIESLTCR